MKKKTSVVNIPHLIDRRALYKMSVKQLLGLEQCPISEEDILEQIEESRRRMRSDLEFKTPSGSIHLHLSSINPRGMTYGYWDYFSKR